MSKRARSASMGSNVGDLVAQLHALSASSQSISEELTTALAHALQVSLQAKRPVLMPSPGQPVYRRRADADIAKLSDRSHCLSLLEPIGAPSTLIYHTLPEEPITEDAPLIVTHDGTFHCDEVMAISILLLTPRFRNARILRTRDPALIAQGTVVVDVGGVYDHAAQRYDHHQPTFHNTFTSGLHKYHTRLSSAGLVYLHHGKDALTSIVGEALVQAAAAVPSQSATGGASTPSIDPISMVYDRVYSRLMEEIDGIDNGVEPVGVVDTATTAEGAGGCEAAVDSGASPSIAAAHATATAAASLGVGPPPPCKDAVGTCKTVRRYAVTTTVSDQVSRLVPRSEDKDPADVYAARFAKALAVTQSVFMQAATQAVHEWLPARSVVVRGVLAASTSPHPAVVVLPHGVPSVMDHVAAAEAAALPGDGAGVAGRTLYVVYPSGGGGGGGDVPHRIHAVPLAPGSFQLRKPLTGKGLRNDDLNNAIEGLSDGVFVHVNGFIGEAKSLAGALTLAAASVAA